MSSLVAGMVAEAQALLLERRSPSRSLDTYLEAVDRLAVKWAQEEHPRPRMHPLEAIRLLHDGAILGGGPIATPDDIRLFDECYRAASQFDQAIVSVWYRNNMPVQLKAERVGISRAQLYNEWKRTLSYFRGWLRSKGLEV